jgi:hypothetical protein
MSSTYTKPAGVQSTGRPARRRPDLLGLGAVLAGVAAVGAAAAIFLAPTEAPAVPAPAPWAAATEDRSTAPPERLSPALGSCTLGTAPPDCLADLTPWAVATEDPSTAPPERRVPASVRELGETVPYDE